MRSSLHQNAGEADRGTRRAQAGDRAGAPIAAVHDSGVELDQAFSIESASAAGIEAGVVLENANGRFDRVDGASAFAQDRSAGVERIAQALSCAAFVIALNPRCHESPKTSEEETSPMFRIIGAVVVYGFALWGVLEAAEDLSNLIKAKSDPSR